MGRPLIDLTGKIFGRLTVISVNKKVKNLFYWNAVCECGKQRVVQGSHLKNGETVSCGCHAREQSKLKCIDIKGQVFGRLTVIEKVIGKKNVSEWLCQCECGNKTMVFGSKLRSGQTLSCGCYHIDKITKHGHAKIASSEYLAWTSMYQRCYNENHRSYKNYGGRGIKICDRWLNSFENFYADMGDKPTQKHTLDRYPDNNGNYELSNCRWATMRQQAANTRRNRHIEYNGRTMIMSDWARDLNIDSGYLCGQLKRKSMEEIIEFYKHKKVS